MGNSALALGPAGIRFAPVAELLEDGLQGPSCGRERVDGTRGKLPKYLERPFVTQKVEGGFHGTLGGDGWDFCHAEPAFLHKGIEKYSC